MEPIIQTITATIGKDNEGYFVSWEGRAGPGVGSGSMFGGCIGVNSKAEAIKSVKKRARDHAEWLVSRRDPDTDEVHQINRKVITKLTVDGVAHDINQTSDLTNFLVRIQP